MDDVKVKWLNQLLELECWTFIILKLFLQLLFSSTFQPWLPTSLKWSFGENKSTKQNKKCLLVPIESSQTERLPSCEINHAPMFPNLLCFLNTSRLQIQFEYYLHRWNYLITFSSQLLMNLCGKQSSMVGKREAQHVPA